MMAPSLPVQQVSCNAVLIPSPVFTSSIMISHNSFITPGATPTYTPNPQNNQQGLRIQQHQQFFQVNESLENDSPLNDTVHLRMIHL